MSILHVSRSRLLLLVIVLFGFWTRISGFSSHQLWFDDAWVAVPAKAPLSQAIHMVDTTPLFSIAMRQWILWGPDATWWAQIPAFITGLIAIVAVYRLLKYFGTGSSSTTSTSSSPASFSGSQKGGDALPRCEEHSLWRW